MLTDKIAITLKQKENHKIPLQDLTFYTKYSKFTVATLKNEKFQNFIKWLLRQEKIQENHITNIKIRVFPLKNKKEQWVIGNCNKVGIIKIFPKKRILCLKIASKFGKKAFYSYVKCRAKAALIHEILHLKYFNDEKKVRKLTAKYFKLFDKNRTPVSATKLLFA